MADYIRETFTLSLSSSGKPSSRNFTTQLKNPIKLGSQYNHYVSLVSCGMSKSWYNISPDLQNNSYEFSTNSGASWETKTLASGLWSITALSAEISSQTAGGVIISADSTVGRILVTLSAGRQIKFTNSFAKLLGYEIGAVVISTGLAPMLANIDHINMINVHCDLIRSIYSIVDNEQSQVIYTIPPRGDVSNFEQFDGVTYLGGEYQLSTNEIRSIGMRLTDQDGHDLIFDGEVTYVLKIVSRPI